MRSVRFGLAGLWLFLLGLLPQHELFTNPEYVLSLLAAVGTASFLGYLAVLVQRHHRLATCQRTAAVVAPGPISAGDPEHPGEDWPLLMVLLFCPLPILLSGLGGWVQARC